MALSFVYGNAKGEKTKIEVAKIFYICFTVFVLILLPLIDSIVTWEYILLSTFAFIFYLTTKKRNFSIYQIFLFTFFLFLLSRVFLDVIDVYDFRILSIAGMVSSYMSEDLALETLQVLTIFLIGTSYAWLFVVLRKKNTTDFFERTVLPLKLNSVLRYTYFLFVFFAFLKTLYIITLVRQLGYFAIFDGTIDKMDMPIIFSGSFLVSITLYIVLLFFNRDVHSFKLYASLILLVGLTRALTGQRGFGFVLLLYVIYFWSTYYREVKFLNFKVLLIVALVPIIFVSVGFFRTRVDTSVSASIIGDIVFNNAYRLALVGQGASIEVVHGVIEYRDVFTNEVPFMLGYFVDLFKPVPSGQTFKNIVERNYLGAHLPYILNSEMYFAGRGTGTSIVAETYELVQGSYVGILVVSALLMGFVLCIERLAFKSVFHFACSFVLLRSFMYSPRDSIFKDLRLLVLLLFLCAVILAVNGALSSKSKRHSIQNPGN